MIEKIKEEGDQEYGKLCIWSGCGRNNREAGAV